MKVVLKSVTATMEVVGASIDDMMATVLDRCAATASVLFQTGIVAGIDERSQRLSGTELFLVTDDRGKKWIRGHLKCVEGLSSYHLKSLLMVDL